MSTNSIFMKNVVPTDAKIYYENGKPYMEYKGIIQDYNGDKTEVYLPKINLEMSNIEYTIDYHHGIINPFIELNVTFSGQNYSKEKNIIVMKTIERTMTKAQIEKELGYKVNIV